MSRLSGPRSLLSALLGINGNIIRGVRHSGRRGRLRRAAELAHHTIPARMDALVVGALKSQQGRSQNGRRNKRNEAPQQIAGGRSRPKEMTQEQCKAALNASIGHYIDRLTHNRTPQEVLELFDQYEEKVVAAAYHRFKTSDNLFNYRAYLEEELDDCEAEHLPRLALDYARVERCAPGEAAPAVRALIQKLRDSLEEMSTLMRQIDQSHIRYRKRAVQRAQFLLLSDRSSQGSVTALLRRYAEEIKTPDQLFAPDDGPVAKHLHLYPAAVFGAKPLYPPAAPRSETPLAPVRQAGLDAEQLRKEQQLLLDYARMAVTEENVGLLAKQALAARSAVAASTLAEEYPRDFARIIGLHTYSQSPRRAYDITLTGNWVERGGFRFEEFILTPRREDADHGRTE